MRRVSSWRRLLDIGSDPADDADLAVRKRTAVGTLYALLVVGVVYLVLAFVMLVQQRRYVRPLVRDGLRTSVTELVHEREQAPAEA